MGINDFSLVLGCSGCKYNDLVLCSGTFNLIIDFAGHFEPEKSKQIMDFLDYTCELFDYPMGDWNKITNTLKILYDNFKLIDDKRWQGLHTWFPRHKQCAAFIKLVLNEELSKDDSDEYLIIPHKINN